MGGMLSLASEVTVTVETIARVAAFNCSVRLRAHLPHNALPTFGTRSDVGRANDPSKRRGALHGVLRRPGRPPDPSHHGRGRVDALVGGGLLPDARRRRALRDPLRPP